MNNLQIQVSQELKKQRRAAKLTLKQVETITGIKFPNISRVESGKGINLETIEKLSSAYNVTPIFKFKKLKPTVING